MAEKMKKIVVPKNKQVSNFYIKTLENEYQMALEPKTVEFIDKFFDLYGYSEGKVFYYDAFYMLKKGYFPRKYIYYVLYFRFRRLFRKQNIQQLKGLERFFANATLNSAVAGFCKNKPENNPYFYEYRPKSFYQKVLSKVKQIVRQVFKS